MLRDFPITGNEGATKANDYYSPEGGVFVNKGHGLKELDKVGPSSDSEQYVQILHIDSSREDVDYIQFDRHLEGFRDTVALVRRGETSELNKPAEIAFRAMSGEKVSPNKTQEQNSKAFMRTEALQIDKESWGYLERDRYHVYKGHGLLPGDTAFHEEGTSSPSSFTIQDIISGEQYDEIVLDSSIDSNGGTYINYWYVNELSPDLLAKRNAYISKLQAS